MRKNASPILLLALVAALAVGCAGLPATTQAPPPSPPDLTQPTPAATETEVTMPPTLPPAGDVPVDLFMQMAEEASALAGVPLGELVVERAEAVTWNDGSLGCPEPGRVYTQALVDGYWVVIRAGGQEFDFRASDRGEVRLCPPGQGRPPIDA